MVIKFMEVPDLEMLEYRVQNGENLDRETILRVIQNCLHKVPECDFEEVDGERNYLQDENDKLESSNNDLHDEIDKLKERIAELEDENGILEKNVDKLRDEVEELEEEKKSYENNIVLTPTSGIQKF